jgi:phospholipid/cholesterol/gamma-HCH transport system substrate-binding protein
MMRSARLRRLLAGVLGLFVVASVTTGCGFKGLYSASLPGSVGGPFSGDKTYDVTVYFQDVLDLVPQSAVKVNDVTVGTVTAISLVKDNGAFRAKVVCAVKTSVQLPANTTALLDETSLLGEKFVALVAPPTGGTGSLRQVGHIGPVPGQPATATEQAAVAAYPSAEDVFGVLSTVLTGGGLQNLQTIDSELSAALSGREDQVHDVVLQLNTFVSGLNGVKTQINGAIDALDTLSTNLNRQDATIATALDDLGPGLSVLADERASLVSLLQSLSDLGVISNKVIGASLSSTKADLAALEPILTQLDAAGKALPGSLQLALDYPFPDDAQSGIKGDATNLVFNLDATGTLNNILSEVCATPANATVSSACSTLVNALTGLLGSLGRKAPAVKANGASLTDVITQGAP